MIDAEAVGEFEPTVRTPPTSAHNKPGSELEPIVQEPIVPASALKDKADDKIPEGASLTKGIRSEHLL